MAEANSQIIIGAAMVRDEERPSELGVEGLYDQYAHAMFRYALALTGSVDDAEDAVQEVFVRIARDMKRLRKVSSIKSYLFSATRNAAYSQLRGKKRRDHLHEAICVDIRVKLEEETGGKVATSAALCEAFGGLPLDQREVLLLKVFDEMTFKEIAETTGASINTVASRYRYGIERLRQALEVNDNG